MRCRNFSTFSTALPRLGWKYLVIPELVSRENSPRVYIERPVNLHFALFELGTLPESVGIGAAGSHSCSPAGRWTTKGVALPPFGNCGGNGFPRGKPRSAVSRAKGDLKMACEPKTKVWHGGASWSQGFTPRLLSTRYRSIHFRIVLRISGNSTCAQSYNSIWQSRSLPCWRYSGCR